MFAHTAEARAAQGAHPHRFCGSSLPGHSRVPAPSLRERGKKTVLALSPINTKKGTSSGSQELLPEAHYRELTGFKKRKRRGRSQILWDCLESAESKGKHRPLRRALALGSKQPGSPPCCWCRVACGSPSLLIISKGDFSLESVLWRLDVTYAGHQAQACSRPTGISTAVQIAFLVVFIFTTGFPWRFGFVFHFLTLKMSTFQAVMLPADILKINVLLTSFWFFIEHFHTIREAGEQDSLLQLRRLRWGELWDVPKAIWLLNGRPDLRVPLMTSSHFSNILGPGQTLC